MSDSKVRNTLNPHIIMLVLFIIWGVQYTFAAEDFYSVSPAFPPWVQEEKIPAKIPAVDRDQSLDVRYLLIDRQTRVSSQTVERFNHYARQILSVAGIQDRSELVFGFDPAYETLTLHYIQIHRNRQVIPVLDQAELRVVQQERELDRRIYNGQLTLFAFVHDVRVDDVIEYAYSIAGVNPVLRDHFTSATYVGWSVPVIKYRYRLLWPAQRELFIKNQNTAVQPVIRDVGSFREYSWSLNNTRAIKEEDKLPSWYDPYPWIQFSEFATWRQVVDWALPLYVAPPALPQSLQAHIKQWSSVHLSDEKRLLAAIRFVQDNIRYLGMELGPHSLQPHDPQTVYKRRFGDCKDKSWLLIIILRHLGYDSYPALVDTESQHFVAEMLPSPQVFNHVIVNIRFQNHNLWIDPSQSYQRGHLGQYRTSEYQLALVLKPNEKELTAISQKIPDSPRISIFEHYTISDYQSPVKLKVISHYRGGKAASLRYHFATESVAAIEKRYLNYFAKRNEKIKLAGRLEFVDDEDQDLFQTTEKYQIPQFWTDYGHEFKAWSTLNYLSRPSITKRQMPLALSYPMFIRHVIEINVPEEYDIKNEKKSIDTAFLNFSYQVASSRRTITLTYEFKTRADHILPRDMENYLQVLDEIYDSSYYQIWYDTPDAPAPPGMSRFLKVIISRVVFYALVLALLAIPVFRVFRSKITTGKEGIVGEIGEARSPITDQGGVAFVHGERWNVVSTSPEIIEAGEKVVVEAVTGMILKVKAVGKKANSGGSS
ncbi:DUF3857 domain-containing protein [candidate division CSSED10-310 bacterium]|uniref:DUF3857 domain-containing protein n=1 Tax=candidate division CSSED10-310 bacterium TaxID=2855610 RepID=A0ABV6YTK2_UNCC1